MSALGQLSPDQARYLERVAAGTGLHPVVVRSWIGSESGWGVTKPTHNYLNVGPHEHFESVDQAADRVIGLIRNSRHYEGIRGAIPRGPVPQVAAIVASPWDAGHYQRDYGNLLVKTYERNARAAVGLEATPAGWLDNLDDAIGGGAIGGAIEGAGNLFGGGSAAGLLGLDKVGESVLKGGLGLVFTLGAFAIIVLGLHKLTGVNPKAALGKVQGAAGVVAPASRALSAVT